MKMLTVPALSNHIPGASVDDRVTGEVRTEIRRDTYSWPGYHYTLAIGSYFDGPEMIFFINDAFFSCRFFVSDPISPIIPGSDSLLFSIFGKEAGGHRLF